MRPQVTQALPGTSRDPLYPDSDGKPVGETDYHMAAMIWLREALQDFYAPKAKVYVASNMLLYYEQGNPRAKCDPDVFVAKGVGKHQRRSFRTWEEKTLPRVVFEISSGKTWRRDLKVKPPLYAGLKIPEYILFDPEGVYLNPVLQGFRLERGDYASLTPAADGSLTSKELGLRMVPEYGMLRLIDVRTGKPVLTRQEQTEQLAAEVERLRALLLQRKPPQT